MSPKPNLLIHGDKLPTRGLQLPLMEFQINPQHPIHIRDMTDHLIYQYYRLADYPEQHTPLLHFIRTIPFDMAIANSRLLNYIYNEGGIVMPARPKLHAVLSELIRYVQVGNEQSSNKDRLPSIIAHLIVLNLSYFLLSGRQEALFAEYPLKDLQKPVGLGLLYTLLTQAVTNNSLPLQWPIPSASDLEDIVLENICQLINPRLSKEGLTCHITTQETRESGRDGVNRYTTTYIRYHFTNPNKT